MTDAALNAAPVARTRKHVVTWQLFLVLVAAATLFPFAFVPVAARIVPEGSSALYVYFAISFLAGNFHVASTGWFYTDPEMRSFFRSRPLRYFVIPCVLIVGSTVVFYFADRSIGIYLLIPFLAWQIWHYQKQNVGLLSFISTGTNGAPLSIWERRTLELAAVAGILGFFSLNPGGPKNLSAEFLVAHQIGVAVYWLVPIAFCIAVFKTPDLRTNKLRLLFFTFGGLFFLPIFVFADPIPALAGYAIAHGLQYLVFMGFVSAGKRNPIVSLIALVVIATCGGIILDRWTTAPNWHDFEYNIAVYGAFVGVVMTHFVLDAGIWRLREPFQRGYVRKKFFFVFDR